MAGIQVGGIVSGMDTNALVDKLIKQAQIPVDRLYGDYEYLKLEDEVFTGFNNKLGNLASDLLTMRLESTFKTKLTNTSNSSVVTATAGTDAAVGNHSIQVDQLARNSQATSSFTRFSLSQEGSTVTKVTGMADDYLEGVHEVSIEDLGTGTVLATTEMSVKNVGTMSKSKGADLAGADVDSLGELLTDFTGDFTISYEDTNGNAQTLTVSDTFGSTGQDINDLARNLEQSLNDELNTALGTNAVQYLAIRGEYNSGTWNMAMYETTVADHNISVGGTDAGSLRDELGFAEAYSPSTSTTTKIYKYHASDSLTNLQNKIFSPTSGVVAGATFTLSGVATEGSFTIAQDATLKVSSDTYTYYKGAAASTGGGLDTTAVGLDSAGFAATADSSTNGFFTINDVKITIDDYTDISVNDMLGIINSSGAGVTATYDSTEDKFSITSNNPGSTTISLGGYGDTSNVLELMKMDYASSPTLKTGSTSGNIDASVDLQNSGLTTYPYSGTFTINGVSIYVDAGTDSLNDVINKVNNSGAGVTMAYDSISDKVTLRSDGIDAIEVGSAGDTSNLLEALNLTDDTNTAKTIGSSGQRAILTVDGTTYVRESNTVSDIINGVTLMLNGTSSTAASVGVEVDTEKALEAFSKFIAHYNEIIEDLVVPEKTDEEDNYTDYLSETDKETMSDSDIESYMENYKTYNTYDIIRRSSELRNLDTNMRTTFFSVRSGITGSINDMSDLGIEVAGAGDLQAQNLGYLVEFSTDYEEIMNKLRENSDFMSAISEKPDEVFNFFANSSEEDTEQGWARYYNKMLVDRYTSDTGMIGNKLGLNGSIKRELSELENRIVSQEDRVQKQLERYWDQFTAMEMAIADAQAQAQDFTNAGGG